MLVAPVIVTIDRRWIDKESNGGLVIVLFLYTPYSSYLLAQCLYTSGTSSLLAVDLLDVFSLGQSTLVGTQTSLSELVDTLIRRGTSRLDHIQNSALIRGQSNDLTGNFSA